MRKKEKKKEEIPALKHRYRDELCDSEAENSMASDKLTHRFQGIKEPHIQMNGIGWRMESDHPPRPVLCPV